MKRLICLLFCVILLGSLALPASAAWNYIRDRADLLTDQEERELQSICENITEHFGLDAVILTVDSLEGASAQSYADDYCDTYLREDGVLLLIAMAEREYYITTSGQAITWLSDDDLWALEDHFLYALSAGDYNLAFYSFLQAIPDYLETGRPVDSYYDSEGNLYVVWDEEEDSSPKVNWLISLIGGAVVGLIGVSAMASSMNTKKAQRSASNYQSGGKFHLKTHQDLFLYSNITKQPRPQNPPTTRGGGGGGVRSSMHHSSAGRSHGGRGGRF